MNIKRYIHVSTTHNGEQKAAEMNYKQKAAEMNYKQVGLDST